MIGLHPLKRADRPAQSCKKGWGEIGTHKPPESVRESRTCAKRVDARHINYNDFLPLTAERDLNYRYPAWRAGAGCPGLAIPDYRVCASISGIRLAS